MSRKAFIGVLCGFALVAQLPAQEVVIVREAALKIPKAEAVAPKQAAADFHVEKAIPVQPVKVAAPQAKPSAEKATTAQLPAQKPAPQGPTVEIGTAKVTPPASPEVKQPKVATAQTSVALSPTVAKPAVAEMVSRKPTAPAPAVALAAPSKPATTSAVSSAPKKPPTAITVGSAPAKLNRQAEKVLAQPLNLGGATAFTKLANGFDFPIGKPDAQHYYKARGFQTRGHLGEDWDGTGGGDTDMGDPVFSIGDGVIVFARDCHQGWGNVVIVRHAYREGGTVKNIDSLYAHCQKLLVRRGEAVSRGQQVATIGSAHGLYDAHLHFEIRKNIAIGMSRDKFAKDLSNYCDPTQFIASHRHLQSAGGNYRVAMNTYTYDEKIRWDKLRNYSRARTGGGSSQSARALKKAVVAQNVSDRAN